MLLNHLPRSSRENQAMKRLLAAIAACLIVLVSFAIGDTAHAQSLVAVSSGPAAVDKPADLMEQLKTQFLQQIESILTPDQRTQLETAVVEDRTSLRKAFKSITLTPAQKTKLAAVFKSLPAKDFLTSLTPEQKKQFFMNKKEIFSPTPEEISAKISDGMNLKETP